jgi:hypothetical protein
MNYNILDFVNFPKDITDIDDFLLNLRKYAVEDKLSVLERFGTEYVFIRDMIIKKQQFARQFIDIIENLFYKQFVLKVPKSEINLDLRTIYQSSLELEYREEFMVEAFLNEYKKYISNYSYPSFMMCDYMLFLIKSNFENRQDDLQTILDVLNYLSQYMTDADMIRGTMKLYTDVKYALYGGGSGSAYTSFSGFSGDTPRKSSTRERKKSLNTIRKLIEVELNEELAGKNILLPSDDRFGLEDARDILIEFAPTIFQKYIKGVNINPKTKKDQILLAKKLLKISRKAAIIYHPDKNRDKPQYEFLKSSYIMVILNRLHERVNDWL